MAKQTINVGTAPTGAGGDTFRSAAAKMQVNTDELYAQLGGTGAGNATLPAALPIAKGGTGATTVAAARTALGLGTAGQGTLTTSKNDRTEGRVLKVGDLGFGTAVGLTTLTMGDALEYTHFGSGDRLFAGYAHPYLSISSVRSFLIGAYNKEIKYVTQSENESLSAIHTIRSTSNTTIDSNGFIKAASPIVNLFADRIELNDEAGLQEITFEKVAVGDYLIKGSLGFAQEGWYVETPKDANGNVLFSVIYETLENGDISVKTYKKKFDLETASIIADLDKPVDITEGRWIDMRLQELPQTEIEVIDEPE